MIQVNWWTLLLSFRATNFSRHYCLVLYLVIIPSNANDMSLQSAKTRIRAGRGSNTTSDINMYEYVINWRAHVYICFYLNISFIGLQNVVEGKEEQRRGRRRTKKGQEERRRGRRRRVSVHISELLDKSEKTFTSYAAFFLLAPFSE